MSTDTGLDAATLLRQSEHQCPLDAESHRLREAFLSGTLDAEGFGHREHVRLAWALMKDHDLWQVGSLMAQGLRTLAERKGLGDLYHETLTVAFLILIHERRLKAPDGTWRSFALANADLIERGREVLSGYYSEARLNSTVARTNFLFPDRAPSAEAASSRGCDR